MQVSDLHAAFSGSRARTLARLQSQCESGNGKACYSYGQTLWPNDRKAGKKAFLRGCELSYKLACRAAKDHNTIIRHTRKPTNPGRGEGTTGTCFHNEDLSAATLTPNTLSPTVVHGQRITAITPNSFWAKVGLNEGDIINRVNNMPFNSRKEIEQAFATAGKHYAFEVQHGGLTVTLWYSCQ